MAAVVAYEAVAVGVVVAAAEVVAAETVGETYCSGSLFRKGMTSTGGDSGEVFGASGAGCSAAAVL